MWFQKYFRSFIFSCLILPVIGVDLLQFLGIWFSKATTEESFSLTRTKPPFPPRRNRVNHAHNSQSEMTCKILNTVLVYFQHTPKNYIDDIFSLAACLWWLVINLILCFQTLSCLGYNELLALFVLAQRYNKAGTCMLLNVELRSRELVVFFRSVPRKATEK